MKLTLTILASLTLTWVTGQINLVPNNSFEQYTTCPTGSSQLSHSIGWLNPTTSGTADYYNICSSTVGVPYSGANFQYPKTGNAFAGIYCRDKFMTNIREYMQIKLTDTLASGQCYYIGFYTNLKNFAGIACNRIGAHLSSNAISLTGPTYLLNYLPQIELFNNKIVKDTLNWTLISGILEANGGENYITIGNFYDDNLTDSITMTSGVIGGAYYYVDDVFTKSIDSITFPANAGRDTSIAIGDSIFIGQAISNLNCNWYQSSTLIASNISGLYVKPSTTTSYVVEQNLCGSITYDTVVVTINTVGINEYKNNGTINVYPNPFGDKTILEFTNTNNSNCVLTLYDMQGQLIRTINNITSNKISIEKENLTNGLYFFILKSSGSNIGTGKLTVE